MADHDIGYVLHNLKTLEDFSALTEPEALELTATFDVDADWSLWRMERDGHGCASMVAVGCGPART